MNLKNVYGFLDVPKVIAFDLWALDLVKTNIPVLHSLSFEEWHNFTWNSIIQFKNIYFQKEWCKFQVNFSLPLELRLWRTGMLLLTKSKGCKSNAIILGTCWRPKTFFKFIRTYSNIGLLYHTLPWMTL